MLVSENDGNHRQVAGHPHHEDDHIKTDEDRLHPGLEDVELLGPAAGMSGIDWTIGDIRVHHISFSTPLKYTSLAQ